MPYLQQDHEICTRSNARGARNVKQAEPVQRPRRFLAEVADGDDDEARRRGGGSCGTASHANVIHRSPGVSLVSGERVLERCDGLEGNLLTLPAYDGNNHPSPRREPDLPYFTLLHISSSSQFPPPPFPYVAANTLEYSTTTGTEASTAPDIGLNWSNLGAMGFEV